MSVPNKLLNELDKFLAILANTARTMTVEDVAGTPYTVVTALPAGRQLQVVAALDAALDDATIRDAFAALQGVAQDTGGDQVLALARVARMFAKPSTSARLLAILDALVKTAYPDLPAPASKHFEIQEVLKVLLPFVGRLLHAVSTVGQVA